MQIEIIAIGSELTAGVTIDTNSAMLAQKLRAVGLEIDRVTLVSDQEDQIIQTFAAVFARADAAIVTGGLGPTEDDRTRFAAAKVFGAELKEHAESVDRLKMIFKAFNREMPESNRVQAMFPIGAQILENPMGTARGFACEVEGRIALFLPGVPRELEIMADQTVVPMLVDRAGLAVHIATVTLNTFGETESGLADRLKDFTSNHPEVELAYSAKFPTIELRLSAKGGTKEQADQYIADGRKYIEDILCERIFSQGGKTLPEVMGQLLIEKGLTLATAESCTGGMIGAAVTNASGSSEYFLEAAVTYSNDAKMNRLGVRAETLETYGAVSEETAIEMAEGIRKISGADLGVSVTGIAGPTGGTPEKPVGTVHMALAYNGGVKHWMNRVPGNRERVRNLTTYAAIDRVRRFCLGVSMEKDAQYNCKD
jgi:nicotinamide-nucleotide amidase